MQIKLLRNLVALRLIIEEKSAGGLTIVTKGSDTKKRGEVMAVGAGTYNIKGDFIPTTVKVGDIVAYSGSGDQVEIDGKKLSILPEDSIIGVIV